MVALKIHEEETAKHLSPQICFLSGIYPQTKNATHFWEYEQNTQPRDCNNLLYVDDKHIPSAPAKI